MTLTTERDTTAEAASADRRRPGRLKQVSPELIPLLRVNDIADEGDDTVDEDQLSGARGIVAGVACSVPLWVGVAYVGRWLLS